MNDTLIQSILGGIMTAVIGGVAGLFVRLRKLESQQEKAHIRIENVEDREGITELKEDVKAINAELKAEVKAINSELKNLHLCLIENYISREEWVPTASKILGSLEKQRELLARHDERMKHQTKGVEK